MVEKFQRAEASVMLAAALAVYSQLDASWLLFAGLLLLPDAFMIGYLRDNRIGALAYNIGHSYFMPGLFVIAGIARDHTLCLQIASIWTAHIAMDRALGYGLKTEEGFKHTHLGNI